MRLALAILIVSWSLPASADCRSPSPNLSDSSTYVRLTDAAAAQGAVLLYASAEAELFYPSQPPPHAEPAGPRCFFISSEGSQLFVALKKPGYSRSIRQISQLASRKLNSPFVYIVKAIPVLERAQRPVSLKVAVNDTPTSLASRFKLSQDLLPTLSVGADVEIPFTKTYTVQRGDSLWSVSQLFDSGSVVALAALNDQGHESQRRAPLSGDFLLKTGDELIIGPSRRKGSAPLAENIVEKFDAEIQVRQIGPGQMLVPDPFEPNAFTVAIYERGARWHIFPVEGIAEDNNVVLGTYLGEVAKRPVSTATCKQACPNPFLPMLGIGGASAEQ